MRVLTECKWEAETQPLDSEDTVYEKGQFWLLHFGLEYKLIETDNGIVPVNFTVALCQDCKTGEIFSFLPTQLRILGKTVNE